MSFTLYLQIHFLKKLRQIGELCENRYFCGSTKVYTLITHAFLDKLRYRTFIERETSMCFEPVE